MRYEVWVLLWLGIGYGFFWVYSTKTERDDFNWGLLSLVLWPVGLFSQLVLAPIRRRKDERARQRRISEKVQTGALSIRAAREKLGWKGFEEE